MSADAVSGSGVSAPSPGDTGVRPDGDAGSTPPLFYLNVVVLNKDAVVEGKVAEKVGMGPLGFGLARKAATALAKRATKDEKVAESVALGIVEQVPDALRDMGLDVAVTPRHIRGPLIVLLVELRDVDAATLIAKAKGPDFGASFVKLTDALTELGIEPALQTIRTKVFAKAKSALMDKLETVLPEKLGESGIDVSVEAVDTADEAEWFFSFVETAAGAQAREGAAASS